MIHQTIQLKENNPNIVLKTYVREPVRGVKPRPAVIVCPGGGYSDIAFNEAEPLALSFNALGYNAFVLNYTVLSNTPKDKLFWPEPLYDLASAVLTVKEHASEWDVDPDQLFLCGSSAGGHLSATYANSWNSKLLKERFGRDAEDFRVKAVVLLYSVLDLTCVSLIDWKIMWPTDNPKDSFNRFFYGKTDPTEADIIERSPAFNVHEDSAPCFLVHAQDDSTVMVEDSLHMAEALRKNNVPFELHVFQKGNHGFALANNGSSWFDSQNVPEVAEWVRFADIWLRKHVHFTLAKRDEIPFHMPDR